MSAITASKCVPKVIPPSSPFGELLRRSRFASFDPAIRQTYSAPPSYTHRGNWGLKRPIANRSKRGAIVLRNFEEHAQYIEWDRADHQVKVIKSVEELNTTPGLVPQTSWFIGLGQAATIKATGFDSDFCPGESPKFHRFRDERYKDEAPPSPPVDQADWSGILPSTEKSTAVNLESLGRAGKGNYGAKATVQRKQPRRDDESLLQPNINAMTPVEFKRYLEHLRKLRPKFIKYLRQQLEKDHAQEVAAKKKAEKDAQDGKAVEVPKENRMSTVDPNTLSDAELVLKLGHEATTKYLHMAFLGRYNEDQTYKTTLKTKSVEAAAALANKPGRIRKQPHKLGGLVYAMPTELESLFTCKPQPGLVLQDTSAQSQKDLEGDFLATLGPLTVRLPKAKSGTDTRPLYSPFVTEPVQGIQAPRIRDPDRPGKFIPDTRKSERLLRPVSIQVEETPIVVGEGATNKPLARTRLRTVVAVDGSMSQMYRTNPFFPGTLEYSAQLPPTNRVIRTSLTQQYLSKTRLGKLPAQLPSTSTPNMQASQSTLDSLQGLLKQGSTKKKIDFRPSGSAASKTEPEAQATEAVDEAKTT
ncbi:hypothetical protein JR316_0003891 [Psilocybe cubensis]|uniref:Uncharacterized protein n=2 Tax=Psilocybe cubensis TaxID=181762 RepID=A0ACB8H9K8_PSICU|nr:hypothetical protein JR316_0003891 [Psilocybe cubensis]KAH9484410.1 hypothetical protein JR316_0003891 [Psilocybe cubensis]